MKFLTKNIQKFSPYRKHVATLPCEMQINLLICTVMLPAAETRQCRGLSMCVTAVLLRDKELSRQLTSGTRICDDILSQFCDSVNRGARENFQVSL